MAKKKTAAKKTGRPLPQNRDYTRLAGSELSRMLGYDRTRAAHWAKEGCPRNADGTYSLTLVHQWLVGKVEKKATKEEAELDGDVEQAKLRRVKRLRETWAFQKDKGKYLKRDEVVAAWSQSSIDARILLETIPDRVSMLVGDIEARAIAKRSAERIVDSALRSYAKGLRLLEKDNSDHDGDGNGDDRSGESEGEEAVPHPAGSRRSVDAAPADADPGVGRTKYLLQRQGERPRRLLES